MAALRELAMMIVVARYAGVLLHFNSINRALAQL